MASTSDPPAAGGGEASSVSAAVAPSAEPPPPSSSSSKRRWSPCTWRYAIEEVQPELGSRPRSSSNNNPLYSSSSLRVGSADHASLPASSKSRPPHHTKEAEEPAVRRSNTYSNRTWGGVEISELRARHAQPRAQDSLGKKKRPPQPQSHQHHQQKEPVKRPKEEEEEEDEEEEWDEDDGEDAERGLPHSEENKKRKRREMSPSELYYCEICCAKAADSTKAHISTGSPPLSQDP